MTTCTHCFQETDSGGSCPRCGHDPNRRPWRPPALPPGTELGGEYRLGRVLGKGGFGITYVALDVNLERRVAIKEFFPSTLAARGVDQTTVVPTDEGRFTDWRRRFLDEAKALARLEHAHVVRVLRFFESGGTAYMVMEYYEGETLAERLDRVGRMAPPEALAVMGPILEALAAAHGTKPHPLIHRDVKPANIFLLAGGRPVLLDFGAARHAAMGDDPKSLSVVLTPGFAPYEQYSRRGVQGPWTDVYGAAATLYRMVTGEDTPDAVDRKDDDQLKPPQAVAPAIGRAFSQAVLRGLAMKPQDRPQTARAFRELLQSSLGSAGGTLREEDVVTELEPTVVRTVLGDATRAGSGTHPPVTPVPPSLVKCPLCGKKNDPRDTFECRECKTDDLCLEHRDPVEMVCQPCLVKRSEISKFPRDQKNQSTEERKVQETQERNRKEIRRSGELARFVDEQGGHWDHATWKAPLESFRRKGWDPLDEEAVGADLEREQAAWASREKSSRGRSLFAGGAKPVDADCSGVPRPDRECRLNADGVWERETAMEGIVVSKKGFLGLGREEKAVRTNLALLWVPAGSYTRGSNSAEALKDEKPPHQVKLTRGFWLGKHPVTQAQWKAVMGGNPSNFQGDDLPVEQVSWNDCQEFLRKLNQRDPGKGYRLPTEAEWEYACRAGTTGDRYGDIDAVAWYDKNSGGGTHTVGKKKPNAWGFYDMLGNVWEWCMDWYDDYPSVDVTDPTGPSSGSGRVDRGGGWYNIAQGCRAAFRSGYDPGSRGNYLGFRLARDSAR